MDTLNYTAVKLPNTRQQITNAVILCSINSMCMQDMQTRGRHHRPHCCKAGALCAGVTFSDKHKETNMFRERLPKIREGCFARQTSTRPSFKESHRHMTQRTKKVPHDAILVGSQPLTSLSPLLLLMQRRFKLARVP